MTILVAFVGCYLAHCIDWNQLIALGIDRNCPEEMTLQAPAPLNQSSHSKIRIEPSVLDFGDIPTNDSKSIRFRVFNTDTKPHTVLSSRGKQTVKFQGNATIPPGGSVELEASLTGGPRPGPVLGKMITIVIEDLGAIAIPMRGNAVSFIEVDLSSPYLMNTDEREICLRSIDGRPFRILGVQPDCADYVTNMSKNQHIVVLNRRLLDSVYRRQVIFYFDHPSCQTLFMDIQRPN